MIKILLTGKYKDSFFVDYSSFEVYKGQEFNNGNIILKKISDQFGNELDSIPRGWRTICDFDFISMPENIKNLPLQKEWIYNPNGVIISA